MENTQAVAANKKQPDPVKRFFLWANQFISFKWGSVVGGVQGIVVYFINSGHGFGPASFAFLKQLLYGIFIAGFNIKTCQKLAERIKSKPVALISASLFTAAQSFVIVYAIHFFGRTPEALKSSAWQFYVNILAFFVYGILFRRAYEKRQKEKQAKPMTT